MLSLKKPTIITIFFLLTVSLLSADTIPGGNVSGTWYQANSPYYITGNITILGSDTLLIEPGVSVNFLGNYSLNAQGRLEAVGTEADSIHFFPEDTVSGWQGIVINSSAIFSYPLSYCSFKYASLALSDGGSGILGLDVDILHCSFRRNDGAIYFDPWGIVDLQITECTFRDNGPTGLGAAIHLQGTEGPVDITGCLFENNTASNDGGAIRIYNWGNSTISISNCEFLGNTAGTSGGAIWAQDIITGGVIVVENCLFGENTAHGSNWYLGGGAIWGTAVDNFDISYCCFYNNVATGLYGGSIHESPQWGDSDFSLDHCTFWGGSSAIEVFGAGYSTRFATLDVTNCIFTHCDIAICNHSNITLTMEYSDFYNNQKDIEHPPAGFGVLDRVNYNGDSCDCYYDIFMDPMFVDTTNFNFHLLAGSPCIDAGDTAFAYDPDSTITDMGAYYYHHTAIEEDHPREPSPVKLTCTPVPFRTEVRIQISEVGSDLGLLSSDLCVKIYDVSGRLVKKMSLVTCNLSLGAQATWDAKGIAPGIYFISINGSIKQKVVKIR